MTSSRFDVSPAGLIALKDAGVPDALIEVMQERRRTIAQGLSRRLDSSSAGEVRAAGRRDGSHCRAAALQDLVRRRVESRVLRHPADESGARRQQGLGTAKM
jgi:hypothetical protein